MITDRVGSGYTLVASLTTLFAIAGMLSAKPPELPRPGEEDPVGIAHWNATGQCPTEVTLRRHEGIRSVILSGGGRPQFNVAPGSSKPRRNLQLYHANTFPEANSNHNRRLHSFDLGERDVVPIYDQIYRVTLDSNGVRLARVTEQLPKDIRPTANSRMISLAEPSARLFCSHYFQKRLNELCDTVTLNIDPQTLRVNVELVPQGKDPPGQPPRKVMNLTVGKGDLLSARGRAYRVLNVVPPQKLDGVGNLVGWIEISADPVEPTEE